MSFQFLPKFMSRLRNRLIGRLAAVVFLACLGCGFQQSQWREFAPPSGDFTVSLPGEPRPVTQTSDTERTQVNNPLFMLETGEVSYVIGYTDLTYDLTEPGAIESALNNGRDQAVSKSGGELESQKNITLAGHPGREMKVRLSDGSVIRARSYLVKRRLYQLIVVTSPALVDSPAVNRFFGSFKPKMN